MTHPLRLVCLLLAVLVLGACSASKAVVRHDGPTTRFEGPIAVAPVVVMRDVPGAITVDPFHDGLHVGHLHMAGGYVVIETERGMQHRSKTVEPSAEAEYAAEAVRWVDRAVADALARRKVDARPIDAIPPEAFAPPMRHLHRGTGDDDLRDNQNLPRFDLDPGPLDPTALPALPAGAEFVLVPFLVHYYSHNGGWFIGQTYGTGGGARARVLWAVYDVGTGRPLRWGEVSARRLERRRSSPSRAEIEDYLMEVEKRGARALERSLLR